MQASDVMAQLKNYIVNKVLDGKDIGLDEQTPLLEWGIINSMEIVRILAFVRAQFGVDVPPEKMTADHFTTLSALTDLVMATADTQTVTQ